MLRPDDDRDQEAEKLEINLGTREPAENKVTPFCSSNVSPQATQQVSPKSVKSSNSKNKIKAPIILPQGALRAPKSS